MDNARTNEEIVARIEEIKSTDFFGAGTADLIAYLPFMEAKKFLKETVGGDDWKELPRDHASIIAEILAYMPFAWDKANNCRGLSAARSLNHMQAWLWMLGEVKAAEGLDKYTLYGKPQLRAICEHFGWNWQEWDNNNWSNDESRGTPASAHEPLKLEWLVANTGLTKNVG